MARIVSIFQFTGRVGSAVGSKGKGGKVVLRQYQPSVANPRTPAQMSQRAKMKLAAQVAGMLGEVGRAALIANGNRKTDRGLLIKRLLQNVKVNADGTQATLAYDLNLIDNPSYVRSLSLAIASEANAFTASFTGVAEGETIAKCILVHDVKSGTWRHASAMDTGTAISIGKNSSERDSELEVFAYGIVLLPKTSEGLNSVGQTGADREGYVVDLNTVSTTNFDFSPIVSAALNVAANGTTEASNGSIGNGGTSGGSSNSGQNNGNTGGGEVQEETLAAPVISGTNPFVESTEVTITGPEGAEIHYTTDGYIPTANSTRYTEPFTITGTTNVRAIAIMGEQKSQAVSRMFTKSSGGGEANE